MPPPKRTTPTPKFPALTTGQLAALIGISRGQVSRLATAGNPPAVRAREI